MRTVNWIGISLGFVTLGMLTQGVGCYDQSSDCTLFACASGSGTGSSTSSSTSSTATGGTPMNCIPSEDPKTAVDASCGVFVSATGDDGATGAQDKPVQSLKQAVMLALNGEKRIYACAEEFVGTVELPAGLTVYGGLACGATARSWLYVGGKAKTTLTADAERIPLSLASGAGTKLFDLHVIAKAALNAGGSSIAVVADQVTAEVSRCLFEAADGKAGAQGKPYSSAASAGSMGVKGGDACSMNTVAGGDPVASMCGVPDSTSGNGGSGFAASGGNGSSGLPDGVMNFGTGEGASACTTGTKGNDGIPGVPGPGATGLGVISKNGFAGVIGMPGLIGPPGQGGGGGGGAKGGGGALKCPGATTGGAAGGSGGSGGCGGAGGKGGNPGGSSIALLSLSSALTFSQVTLTTGKGGDGGDGGAGQDGGFGGSPGTGGAATGMSGLNPGCSGGPGGSGGKGGKGGGGLGGHSLAIAFMGNAPAKDGWTATTGTFGAGGLGGDAAGEGAPGVKADMQEFK